MKTKLTETKFKSAFGWAGQLFGRLACLGAAILICSSASAQNLFVSGFHCGGGIPDDFNCGALFKFIWDGQQSIFAAGLSQPGDLAFDRAGNLFYADCSACWTPHTVLVIYKIAPNGVWTSFAFGPGSYRAYLAADNTGNLFVADSDHGIIYKYTPNGLRTTFAFGLYHPVGLACDSTGNLFVADQGSIYQYKPDGSRMIIAGLNPSDRPADLAIDGIGNLFMADLGGNIYKYDLQGVRRRQGRMTFGSVPNSAQSLVCDTAGNLFVVDAGDVNGNGNMIYKFTAQAVRTPFASGQTLGESFSYLAFQPIPCCQ